MKHPIDVIRTEFYIQWSDWLHVAVVGRLICRSREHKFESQLGYITNNENICRNTPFISLPLLMVSYYGQSVSAVCPAVSTSALKAYPVLLQHPLANWLDTW